MLVAIETAEKEALFLSLYPTEQEGVSDKELLEGATLDTEFATDRGVTLLTAANTVVKRGQEDGIFVFEPTSSSSKKKKKKKDTFEIKVVDSANPHSKSNARTQPPLVRGWRRWLQLRNKNRCVYRLENQVLSSVDLKPILQFHLHGYKSISTCTEQFTVSVEDLLSHT